MECTADRGEAQVLSDTTATSLQRPYPTTINPMSYQGSSFHSIIFHHVNFHLMAPATFFTVVFFPLNLIDTYHRLFSQWYVGKKCNVMLKIKVLK